MEKRPTTSESPLHVPGERTPVNHVITLSIENGRLKLFPGEKTIVDPGDTVTWDIEENSGIASIERIKNNWYSPNVFVTGPAPVPGTSKWMGKVEDRGGRKESYHIKYTKTNDDKVYKFDPIIQVNS